MLLYTQAVRILKILTLQNYRLNRNSCQEEITPKDLKLQR